MKQIVEKQAIINVLNTTGGNHIYYDTTNKVWGITAEGSVKTDDPLTLVTPLFNYGDVKSYSYEDSAAEVKKAVIVGLSSANGEETIVASTRYKLEIYVPKQRVQGEGNPVYKYAYTSPAALTGTASTDRYNVYTALNTKINAYAGNQVVSYVLHKIAFTGGTDGAGTATDITFGETGTQSTSSATVKVAKAIVTSGTYATDDAAGTIWLYDLSGTWDESSETITCGTSLIVVTTAAALTEAQGLVIIDDGSYYQSISAGGITEVKLTAGFTTAAATVVRTGVYSVGIGSVMAKQVPTYTTNKSDVINYGVEGADFLNMNDDVDSSLTYRKYIFEVEKQWPNALKGTDTTTRLYILWVSDLDTSSELTEFQAALAAVLLKQQTGSLA